MRCSEGTHKPTPGHRYEVRSSRLPEHMRMPHRLTLTKCSVCGQLCLVTNEAYGKALAAVFGQADLGWHPDLRI